MDWDLSGRGSIRTKFSLKDLVRVTCSKQMPNLVTFHWNRNQPQLTFLIAQAKTCIEVVGNRFRALKAGAEQESQTQAPVVDASSSSAASEGSARLASKSRDSDSFNADCDSDDLP